jgi:hypothetical protein
MHDIERRRYARVFGGLVFWLFCNSRHTVSVADAVEAFQRRA